MDHTCLKFPLSAVAVLILAACSSDSGSSSGGAAGSAGNDGAGGSTSSTGGSTSTGGGTSTGGTSSTGGTTTGTGGTTTGTGGTTTGTGGTTSGTGGITGAGGSPTTTATAEEVQMWIDAYKLANPGNGGMDWDINQKTPDQIAADPAAQQLLSLCGEGQRPVIPQLAWEYGGASHQWMSPEASALVYCVYIPVQPNNDNWAYDAAMDHVTADMYVLFPDQNPCKDEVGADQVLLCLGDATNAEILVDTASLNDGVDVGLNLSEASTDMYYIQADSTEVHLLYNP